MEKYAPDGPYMKEMTELEKEIVQTYPSYDADVAIKQHAEFAAGTGGLVVVFCLVT